MAWLILAIAKFGFVRTNAVRPYDIRVYILVVPATAPSVASPQAVPDSVPAPDSVPTSVPVPYFRRLTHSVSRYSICPFTERNSESAHDAKSFHNAFDSRRGICFF